MRFHVNSHFVEASQSYQAQVVVQRLVPEASEVETITLTFAQRHPQPHDAVAQAEDFADRLRLRSEFLRALFDQLPHV